MKIVIVSSVGIKKIDCNQEVLCNNLQDKPE